MEADSSRLAAESCVFAQGADYDGILLGRLTIEAKVDAGQRAPVLASAAAQASLDEPAQQLRPVQQALHALLLISISPEQKLPIQVGDIYGVHVNYIDMAKACKGQVLEQLAA